MARTRIPRKPRDWVRDLPDAERRFVQHLRNRIYTQIRDRGGDWTWADRLAGRALEAKRIVDLGDQLRRNRKHAEYAALAPTIFKATEVLEALERSGDLILVWAAREYQEPEKPAGSLIGADPGVPESVIPY